MQRYFIELAYKGTHFHGWQVQPNASSVQEELNKCFSRILQEEINVIGCGRTDTGVHAHFFVAHFDSKRSDLETWEQFIFKLNCMLPTDIVIHKLYKVANEAHARFDAKKRTYHYFITPTKNPFRKEFAALIQAELNMDRMNEACSVLFQHTDFTSFSKLHTDAFTNICHISEAKWTVEESELKFTISADRFLRNMVRAIVGTMLDIGKGKLSIDEFDQIILAKNRSKAGISVPAEGLSLVAIEY